MLVVECKNYSRDIANPEIDQLLGRFDDNRGYLGFITCRAIDDRPLLLKRCQDLAKAKRAFILVFDDKDLFYLLEARKDEDEMRLQGLLHSKFREIIS